MRARDLVHTIDVPPSAEAFFLTLAAEYPHAEGLVWLDSGLGAHTGLSLIALGERLPLDHSTPMLPQLRSALGRGGQDENGAQDENGGRAANTAPQEPSPLGAIGWFGYELRDETMGMPVPTVASDQRAAWLWVDRGVAFDHATGTARLIALDVQGTGMWSAELDHWRQSMLRVLGQAAAASEAGEFNAEETRTDAHGVESASVTVSWRDSDEQYAALVRRCQASIREGDAYQLCLTTQVSVTAHAGAGGESADHEPAAHDPVAIYQRLRRSSPAHHGAYLRIGETTLLSASPETFLRVVDGVVQTRPIKGTRPRHTDAERDAALAAELAANDKEQAENLMIVDLMRNDLARICQLGTVTVTSLLQVESYAHVHQLVSTVEGRLQPSLDALDAVAACLPAGSMTGAPKRRSIELLAQLEAGPRGIYSGAFGYLGVDGSADLAMVIRSIVVTGSLATIGAGGGVTALSDPEAEVAEMHLKAAALLRVVTAERAALAPQMHPVI